MLKLDLLDGKKGDPLPPMLCSICDADLWQNIGTNKARLFGNYNLNCGVVKHFFGWPSKHDLIEGGKQSYLCEDCWEWAANRIGIDPASGDVVKNHSRSKNE